MQKNQNFNGVMKLNLNLLFEIVHKNNINQNILIECKFKLGGIEKRKYWRK